MSSTPKPAKFSKYQDGKTKITEHRLPNGLVRRRVQVVFDEKVEPSLTKQAFQDECDINNILKKFEKTGLLPDLIKSDPQYGDFSSAPDYQQALNTVIHAENQFSALPAKTRERFQNDPAKFLEFCADPSNTADMVKMGLRTVRPGQEVAPTVPPTKDPKEPPKKPVKEPSE